MGGLLPLHPSCYYLYGIAKHASGNQHEIVNCSAHLCAAQGTGLSDQLPAHVVSLLTQNTVQQACCLFLVTAWFTEVQWQSSEAQSA